MKPYVWIILGVGALYTIYKKQGTNTPTPTSAIASSPPLSDPLTHAMSGVNTLLGTETPPTPDTPAGMAALTTSARFPVPTEAIPDVDYPVVWDSYNGRWIAAS
jgi:hypothetical protein